MRLAALALLAAALVAADAPAPAVRLETGNAAGLVAPGAEAALALVIANPGPAEAQAALAATVTGFAGDAHPFAQEGRVAAGGELRIAIPTAGLRLGHQAVAWKLTLDGRTSAGRASFVYARPTGAGQDPAGFRYGICSHPNRAAPELQEREMQATSQIGVGTMRMGVGWEGLEPKPGEWRFERFDHLVDLAERYGLQTQAMFAFCTQHAATPATQELYRQAVAAGDKQAWHVWNRHAPDDAAWRTYVRTVVGRYQGRIRLWEVWNEPDLEGFFAGTTDEYIRMLRSAYAEAKRVDPEVTVLSAGFAGVGNHPGHRLNPDLQARVLAEAGDSFDVHAYHGHGLFTQMVQSVDGELARIRGRMPQAKPLYFNETAMHSAFGTERRQALTLVKKLCFARLRGAIGYTWYDLRNDGTDPADPECNFGLLDRDFQPKPAYAAYNQLIAELRGTRCLGALDLGPGRWGIAFAGGGRRVAVAWNEAPGLPDDPIALAADGCAAGRAVDIMGNASPLPGRDGVVMVRLGEDPQWFELPGGEGLPRVAGALVAVEGSTLVAAGEALALTARIANPTVGALAVTLGWSAADGARREVRTEVAAGGRAEVPLSGLVADAQGRAVEVAYAVEGGPWQGVIAVPLRLVHRIPAGDPATRAPDWTLDDITAVVDFCANDPALREQTWKGPQDLSMRVWLARTSEALRVRAEVRDNIAHQVEAADTCWRGDGLQLGFQVPGQQGFWELGVARHDDGRVLRALWSTPVGAKAAAEAFTATATRVGDLTTYDIAIPCAPFGLSAAILESGLRFNLIANDNDGPLRKGFVRIAPGIGEGKDPSAFPFVRFDGSH